jgi:hypothetical protein
MDIVSFISGFLIGFVCWMGSFLSLKPICEVMLKNFYKLKPIGEKIVFCIVFLFLIGSTILMLMLYPLYGLMWRTNGNIDEFYCNITISFIGSFVGFLFLLFLRWLIRDSIKK